LFFLVGGGCSIPNAVRTVYHDKGLLIDGILLNLDGSRLVKDHVENSDLTVPMTTTKHVSTFFVSHSDDDDLLLPDDDLQSTDKSSNRRNLKRKRTESDTDSILIPPPPPTATTHVLSPPSLSSSTSQPPSPPLSTASLSTPSSATTSTTEVVPLLRHYAHVCGVNINETVLENAELCGTNLAVKLMQMGADSILEEIRQTVVVIPTP
jgi:hypothetical protein